MLNQMKEAENMIDKCLTNFSRELTDFEKSRLYDWRATVYVSQGKYSDCKRDLLKSIQLYPEGMFKFFIYIRWHPLGREISLKFLFFWPDFDFFFSRTSRKFVQAKKKRNFIES